jgi:drug/metabolite transporter (DMT)-like permease
VISSATLWFGAIGTPTRRQQRPSRSTWTCVGLLALALWATWPTLALRALTIPAFECLAIAFACGWLILARLEKAPGTATEAGRGASPLSWTPALACAAGLTGSNAFHIFATHYIPAAEANLISYLWPVEIIGLGALLKLFRLQLRHYAGLFLGLAGAAALMGGGAMHLSFAGMGLAFLSGISWALYCVLRLMQKEAATRVLQRGCALSTVLCLTLHLLSEPTVIPDLGSLASSAAVGIVPLAPGNLAWDEGFRRGDSQLLAVMAYATPLCSALLLIALGMEALTGSLLLGAALVAASGLLSRTDS